LLEKKRARHAPSRPEKNKPRLMLVTTADSKFAIRSPQEHQAWLFYLL
jgi:hypothetical protein